MNLEKKISRKESFREWKGVRLFIYSLFCGWSQRKKVSILNGWHYSGIHIIQLLGCCFLITPLCLCDLWHHFREQILKPQRSWGFPLLLSCTASHHPRRCETLSVEIQQQATSALCWSRYLHKEAEVNVPSILPKAIQHAHGAAFT